LSWLQGRANRKHRFVRHLDDYPWCHALRAILQHCEELSQLFVVDKDMLDFRPTVESSMIDKIEAEVLKEFQGGLFPPLIRTPRAK
jgi:hypothetical protein